MKKYIIILFMALFLFGCAGKGEQSSDPTERGLSYVAGAIMTSAVIRAFFNK